MTPAEEGAYIRLLCHAWRDPNCSIPDDDEALAALSRLGKAWLKGGSTTLRKCFEPHPTILHRLVNQRQLIERARWENWKIKSAEGGVKSGESRRKKNGKGGSRVVEHDNYNSNGNTKKDSEELVNSSGGSTAVTIWEFGLGRLVGTGIPEKNARAFLGRQIKLSDEETVAKAIAETVVKNPANWPDYIAGIVKKEVRRKEAVAGGPVDDDIRAVVDKANKKGGGS